MLATWKACTKRCNQVLRALRDVDTTPNTALGASSGATEDMQRRLKELNKLPSTRTPPPPANVSEPSAREPPVPSVLAPSVPSVLEPSPQIEDQEMSGGDASFRGVSSRC
jgi:hypothetical protein